MALSYAISISSEVSSSRSNEPSSGYESAILKVNKCKQKTKISFSNQLCFVSPNTTLLFRYLIPRKIAKVRAQMKIRKKIIIEKNNTKKGF